MRTLVTRIAAARTARRRRFAEQTHALWEERRRLARELQPDCVLVDIELGEEDGIELAHRLTERAPSTRIVLISAHEQDELEELMDGCPAVGFLPKEALGATAIAGLLASACPGM